MSNSKILNDNELEIITGGQRNRRKKDTIKILIKYIGRRVSTKHDAIKFGGELLGACLKNIISIN